VQKTFASGSIRLLPQEIMRPLILATALITSALMSSAFADDVHEPAKGSAERKAILDALRVVQFPKQEVKYVVNYLRVHNNWAWVDVSPQDGSGKPVAEGGIALMHCKKGTWSYVDTSKVPEDPKDPEGAQDASPGFVKNLIKLHPDLPADIFPKYKK
jgi:hypothetical protein